MDDQIMSAKEAAEFLRMSVDHLYQLNSTGGIPSHKVGCGKAGKLLFLKSELLEWVRTNGQKEEA